MILSLSDLICDDLCELAFLHSDVVISEEALRTMMVVYHQQGLLKSVYFLNLKAQFLSFIEEKMADEDFINTAGHYQFLIEIENRSRLYQRDSGSVHYCAVNLYIRPGKKSLLFVADHFRGFAGLYPDFMVIAERFDFQCLVVGGGVYQADKVHCPIFAMQHLLITASDANTLPLLERMADESVAQVINIHWHDLPPDYLLYSQSVKMLFQYVDTVKEKEQLTAEAPCRILENSGFAERLSDLLYPSLEKISLLRNKLKNLGVKYLAAHHAGNIVAVLEQQTYTTEKLMDICYKDQYPKTYNLLQLALNIGEDNPSFPDQTHPIFELVFSNAMAIEQCLAQSDFRDIFYNQSVLFLMQKGFIEPHKLYEHLTYPEQVRQTKKFAVNDIKCNLHLMPYFVQYAENTDFVDSDIFLTIITSSRIKAFFRNNILTSMFEKGLISLEMLSKIYPHKLSVKVLRDMETDEIRIKFLEGHIAEQQQAILSTKAMNSKENASANSISEEECLFDIFKFEDNTRPTQIEVAAELRILR